MCSPVHREKIKKDTVSNFCHVIHFDVRRQIIIINTALVSQYIDFVMVLSLPDQIDYHGYIIQAAALSPVDHFYSQNGKKKVATREMERRERAIAQT